VEQLVARAVSRYPSVAAFEQRIKAAREEVSPAGALPDPMVGAMYQSVGPPWSPMRLMSMAQVEVSQPLYYPGKRDARRRVAAAEVNVRAAQLLELRWQLATEICETYARIYTLDRERESLLAAQQLVQTLFEAVAARYSSGQAEQEAVAKITLERFMISERLTDLTADRAGFVAVINHLTARPQGAPFGPVRDLPGALQLPTNPTATALAGSPSLRMRRAEIQAARDRLGAADLETRPNFLVGLAAGSTLEAEPVITARFGMELPLWSGTKQEPMVRSARHQLDAARAELTAGEAQIRAALETLLARWKRDNEQIERYQQAILPQTIAAMQAAIAAYVSGRGDFSLLIEDFRLWLDARVSLARRFADRFMTWTQIQALTAGVPLPAPQR
jgi:outer membrane protein TolC